MKIKEHLPMFFVVFLVIFLTPASAAQIAPVKDHKTGYDEVDRDKYIAGMNKELDEIDGIAKNPFTGEERVKNLANAENDIKTGMSILDSMTKEYSSLEKITETPSSDSLKSDIKKMKDKVREGRLNCSLDYKEVSYDELLKGVRNGTYNTNNIVIQTKSAPYIRYMKISNIDEEYIDLVSGIQNKHMHKEQFSFDCAHEGENGNRMVYIFTFKTTRTNANGVLNFIWKKQDEELGYKIVKNAYKRDEYGNYRSIGSYLLGVGVGLGGGLLWAKFRSNNRGYLPIGDGEYMRPQNNRCDICKCLSIAALIPTILLGLGWIIWTTASNWLLNANLDDKNLEKEQKDLDSYKPGIKEEL